jgi:hypothetical protein
MRKKPTIIVSGLGRCGSSLTMQMLSAGGMPCVGAFPDFEDEIVLHPLAADFITAHSGMAIKVLNPHISTLPEGPAYAIIWLDRDPAEQAKSQVKMLNTALPPGDRLNHRARRAMTSSLRKERNTAVQALPKHNRCGLFTTFERIIDHPEAAAADLARFLAPEFDLDAERMARVAIPRSAKCRDDMWIEECLVANAGRCAR